MEQTFSPLAITNVTKRFKNTIAVENLSLELKAGEVFGLLGPNGAGKSTTINMISGVSKIETGNINVFGYNAASDYVNARRLIGVMHQDSVIEQFFPIGPALKIHCGYYGVRDDTRWRESIIERLELGPHLKKKYIRLSGGTQRRFMFAKALLHKPKLLILDEPTAGVDVEFRLSIWKFVRELNAEGTTILLTTHYLDEAEEICNRIGIMNHGKLIALEDTRALVKKVGDKKLLLELGTRLSRVPQNFSRFECELVNDGKGLLFRIFSSEDVRALLNLAQEASLEVIDVESIKPDLEDVFLKLTSPNR